MADDDVTVVEGEVMPKRTLLVLKAYSLGIRRNHANFEEAGNGLIIEHEPNDMPADAPSVRGQVIVLGDHSDHAALMAAMRRKGLEEVREVDICLLDDTPPEMELMRERMLLQMPLRMTFPTEEPEPVRSRWEVLREHSNRPSKGKKGSRHKRLPIW